MQLNHKVDIYHYHLQKLLTQLQHQLSQTQPGHLQQGQGPFCPFLPALAQLLHGAPLLSGLVLHDVPLRPVQCAHVLLGEILHGASISSLGQHEGHLEYSDILVV